MASRMMSSRSGMRTQLPCRAVRPSVCVRATEEPARSVADKATAILGAASLALILSASAPDAAMAARSGGRAGGSSFSRAPARAPARSAPRAEAPAPRAGGTVTNNYYGGGMGMGSPFGFSPFGFSPFGFSPFGGAVVIGSGGGGGIFSFFILFATISVAFSLLSNAVSGVGGGDKKDKKKIDDDSW